jgi:hypothetical protein
MGMEGCWRGGDGRPLLRVQYEPVIHLLELKLYRAFCRTHRLVQVHGDLRVCQGLSSARFYFYRG